MSIDWDALVIGPTTKVFGESVTYTPLNGASIGITGVFDDAYLQQVMFEDGSAGTTEVSAVLGVQLSQFAAIPAQNDQALVLSTGARFVVRDVRNDSHGWAKLLLSRIE
jgi:hypothetical protein